MFSRCWWRCRATRSGTRRGRRAAKKKRKKRVKKWKEGQIHAVCADAARRTCRGTFTSIGFRQDVCHAYDCLWTCIHTKSRHVPFLCICIHVCKNTSKRRCSVVSEERKKVACISKQVVISNASVVILCVNKLLYPMSSHHGTQAYPMPLLWFWVRTLNLDRHVLNTGARTMCARNWDLKLRVYYST